MNIPAVATDCSFRKVGDYLRAEVGARLGAHEVEDCYRVLATVVIEHRQSLVLVVGVGAEHPHSHLSARDALIAMHEIGVPAGFRIAFVALSDATRNSYLHTELEARKRGIRAHVFEREDDAVRWLIHPELH